MTIPPIFPPLSFALRSILKKIALAIIPIALLLVTVETVFRLLGYQPRGSYIRKVDKLEVLDSFYVDTDGIYKAHQNFAWEKGIVINDEGFRSIPFDTPTQAGRPRVAVVSDSFGWGQTARPISMSFADRLQTSGVFTVYNLSIPGTGPDQYAWVIEKYIPLLRPEICALFIYLGNDINLHMTPGRLQRIPAEKKAWYVTNAGMFSAIDPVTHEKLTAEEAYSRTLTPSLRAVNLLRRTASGTQLVNWAYNLVYKGLVKTDEQRRAVNGELLDALKLASDVCASNGCSLVVFPIPVNPIMLNTRNSVPDNLLLFDGYEHHVVTNLTAADYAPFPDDHFNNEGHARMKEFVEQTLKTTEPQRAR